MLDGDPSEPVLENSVIGKGKDMVYEPSLRVMKFIPSSFGQTLFTAKVRGFVYAVNPEFNETGIYLDGSHAFNAGTALRSRFYSSPDQLLGQTEVDHGGFTGLQDVRVTSTIGSVAWLPSNPSTFKTSGLKKERPSLRVPVSAETGSVQDWPGQDGVPSFNCQNRPMPFSQAWPVSRNGTMASKGSMNWRETSIAIMLGSAIFV
jgi:hypothetical protein